MKKSSLHILLALTVPAGMLSAGACDSFACKEHGSNECITSKEAGRMEGDGAKDADFPDSGHCGDPENKVGCTLDGENRAKEKIEGKTEDFCRLKDLHLPYF